MVRVLSISTLFPSPPQPGFGKFVAAQMRGVAARGDVELVMVCPIGVPIWPLSQRERYRHLATCPPVSQLDGATVHHPRFRLVPMIGGDSNPGRIARAVLPVAARLHAEAPFDIVDAQFFFPDGPAAMLVAQALGLPLTIKARGSDIHYWGTRTRALPQLRKAAAASAGMLAVSAALRRDMAALGFPEERIAVHYTGLDHARFRPLARGQTRVKIAAELGIPEGPQLLVTPGNLIAIKGQALAIAALAQLPDAVLALAGGGPDLAALRAVAARFGVTGRVHFLGAIGHDVMPFLMAAADAVVLPSEREGLANVWIEALACGAPLVIPDIGGAREVMKDANAGRIAERDPSAIAAAVRDLLAHPPAQEAVAAHAAGFSWGANAAQLAAFWQAIAAG